MDTITANKLKSLHANLATFEHLVAQARDCVDLKQYNKAAAYAHIAASYAFTRHCGIFSSPQLEQVLLKIGQNAIKSESYPNQHPSLRKNPKNVLHVIDGAIGIGGHARMLCRWIEQDATRCHSVVLVEQSRAEVHASLEEAVLKSQGKIYTLNQTIGSFVEQGKRLKKIGASMDIVVLHTLNHIQPIIAFAHKDQSPPVIYVNHADERIWLGVSISDVVANLRESGRHLSLERRGVEVERNALLPTLLNLTPRTLSRVEAKRQLNLETDSIVILSLARAIKYKKINGVNFAEAHLPLLHKYEQAVLLVVGPGDSEDWSSAIEKVPGRIQVFGQTEETAVFFQAADIYVDSFPWVSNTSLLEAGSYGLPLVSRYPYSCDSCAVIGADMLGFTGNLIQVTTLADYTRILSRLIEDENCRLSLGKTTQEKILTIHTGEGWQRSLEELYERAISIEPIKTLADTKDQMFTTELDFLLPSVVFRSDSLDVPELFINYVRLMPLEKRWSIWLSQLKKRDFGRLLHLSFLLPQWLYIFLQKFI